MNPICHKCKKSCDDESSPCCDSCGAIFHNKCLSLGGSELRVMDLKKQRSLFFFCDDCKQAVKRLPYILRCCEELKDDVKSLKDRVKQLENDANTKHEDIFAELNDREQRSTNIMIFNLKESDSIDVNARRRFDHAAVADLLSDVGIEVGNNDSKLLVGTFRIGKATTGRARPLKVTLSNRSTCKEVLKKKGALMKSHRFSNVRIDGDYTQSQREYLAGLRTDLEQRRANGEDLTIRYVHGAPKIVPVKSQKN